jgi:hypothetical protein
MPTLAGWRSRCGKLTSLHFSASAEMSELGH